MSLLGYCHPRRSGPLLEAAPVVAAEPHNWLIDCALRWDRERRGFYCLTCHDGFTLKEFIADAIVRHMVCKLGGARWATESARIEVISEDYGNRHPEYRSNFYPLPPMRSAP